MILRGGRIEMRKTKHNRENRVGKGQVARDLEREQIARTIIANIWAHRRGGPQVRSDQGLAIAIGQSTNITLRQWQKSKCVSGTRDPHGTHTTVYGPNTTVTVRPTSSTVAMRVA